ncbi:MAG TPA: protein phosphatase 2C domain-containing protein [Anaerolineaceae bacterium]
MYISVFSNAGIRGRNEDCVYPEPGQIPGNLFIVADGLGGHEDGDIASELACRKLSSILEHEDPAVYVVGGGRMEETTLFEAFLSDAVRQVSAAVWHEANQRGRDMGTTLLAVLIHNQRAYVAHIGDCALLMSPGGKMPPVKITSEHRRGSGLARSLGAQESVAPDLFSFDLNDNSVLILGCDGFWEHLSEIQIGQKLLECPPFAAAEELGMAALAAGSQDNVSVIVVEGEGFVNQNASAQIHAYAEVLVKRENISPWQERRQELLQFCAFHAVNVPGLAPVMAALLAYLPDPVAQWMEIAESLPEDTKLEVERLAESVLNPRQQMLPVPPVVEARLESLVVEPGIAIIPPEAVERGLQDRETGYLERIRNLESRLDELQKKYDHQLKESSRSQLTNDDLIQQVQTLEKKLKVKDENITSLGKLIIALWKRHPEIVEEVFQPEWLKVMESKLKMSTLKNHSSGGANSGTPAFRQDLS